MSLSVFFPIRCYGAMLVRWDFFRRLSPSNSQLKAMLYFIMEGECEVAGGGRMGAVGFAFLLLCMVFLILLKVTFTKIALLTKGPSIFVWNKSKLLKQILDFSKYGLLEWFCGGSSWFCALVGLVILDSIDFLITIVGAVRCGGWWNMGEMRSF